MDQAAAAGKPNLRRHWLVLVTAAGILTLLPHLFYFHPFPPIILVENRTLAPLPRAPADLAGLQALPRKIDAYVQDNFPPRTYIIAGISYARYLAGYSTTEHIIVGRDGWLFWDDGRHLAVTLGETRLSPAALAAWLATLKQHLAYAKAHQMGLYLLPAPRQQTIYPEKLPSWAAQRRRPRTEIDQIIDAAQAEGIDQIVDARAALIAAKATRAVYGPYDIHWNGNGAYVAYRELMTRISRDYPDLSPLPQVTPPPPWLHPTELAEMLGITDFVKTDPAFLYSTDVAEADDEKHSIHLDDTREWDSPRVVETAAARSNRTLLLIRDSFSSELLQLLKANFRRVIIVHFQDGWFRKDLIERYHPDITVVETIEEGLRFSMN